MIKVIVFDFDGVILDSEPIKQEGYKLIFSEYDEKVPEAEVKAAREEFAGGKGNRYDIITGILKRLGKPSDKVAEYIARYETVIRKRLDNFVLSAEVKDTLAKLSSQYPLYINSITPEASLSATIQKLGIADFFKALYGSSRSKVENLELIAVREAVLPEEIIFIGDSEGDLRAAEKFDCKFIGFGSVSNSSVHPSVSSLSEISCHLTAK